MPRLKDEDEEEDDELPSGLLPSKRIAHTAHKQQLKDEGRCTRDRSSGDSRASSRRSSSNNSDVWRSCWK